MTHLHQLTFCHTFFFFNFSWHRTAIAASILLHDVGVSCSTVKKMPSTNPTDLFITKLCDNKFQLLLFLSNPSFWTLTCEIHPIFLTIVVGSREKQPPRILIFLHESHIHTYRSTFTSSRASSIDNDAVSLFSPFFSLLFTILTNLSYI